jgi:hypothetical protein
VVFPKYAKSQFQQQICCPHPYGSVQRLSSGAHTSGVGVGPGVGIGSGVGVGVGSGGQMESELTRGTRFGASLV